MEQLKQIVAFVQLNQRGTGGMTETGIGAGNNVLKLGIGEGVANKGLHHAKSGFLVSNTRQGRDISATESWDKLWHIQATIAGKAGQHRLFKGQFGRGATGRDIVQRINSDGLRRGCAR